MTWRYYKICAGKGTEASRGVFYAPDLDTAFKLARSQWPTGPWRCEGSTEPPNGEEKALMIKAQPVDVLGGRGRDLVLRSLVLRGGMGAPGMPDGDVVVQAADGTELARIGPDGALKRWRSASDDSVAESFWSAVAGARCSVQAAAEVDRLAAYLLDKWPGEPGSEGYTEGAVDVAIRLLERYRS